MLSDEEKQTDRRRAEKLYRMGAISESELAFRLLDAEFTSTQVKQIINEIAQSSREDADAPASPKDAAITTQEQSQKL